MKHTIWVRLFVAVVLTLSLASCTNGTTYTQTVVKTTEIPSVSTSATTSTSTFIPSPTTQTTTPVSTLTQTKTSTPTITSTTILPSTTPITPFNFSSVLSGNYLKPDWLSAIATVIDRKSGTVVVKGNINPNPHFMRAVVDWGDGKETIEFYILFPETHTYMNTNINYTITITVTWADQTTDSTTCTAYFLSCEIKPVSLPDNIKVTIPSSPVSLVNRVPAIPLSTTNLTFYDDSKFTTISRSTEEYVLSVAASIQKDFVNDNVNLVDGAFNQVVLEDPTISGGYSLWCTNPIALVTDSYIFDQTFSWPILFHEMGHNMTLNSPENYCFGTNIPGKAMPFFAETMAQIFAGATAYCLVNDYQTYGLSEDLAQSIRYSALNFMQGLKEGSEAYVANGKHFISWNDPSTPGDSSDATSNTIVYKYFEHAETSPLGYRTSLKRMMTLLQLFDADIAAKYDPNNNTEAADTFRSTLMVTALSYAFEQDLRPEFRDLNFPIDDQTYDELYQKASLVPGQ